MDIPLGYGQSGRPPVLVIVSGYSRVITARMLPSRQTGDLIDGHWRLLADGWGAVPKMLVWDNEAGVGKGRLTSEFAAFAGLLAVKVHLCRPRDPEAKGLVERANGYLETSFLPGRTFTGPDDFNNQLTAWLQIANRRQHRIIGARPVDRWEADRAAMLSIPPVAPPHWWRFHTRIGRDHYIRVDTNDYSVHPRAIGRTVMVRADNEEVTVIAGNDIVADTPAAGPGTRASPTPSTPPRPRSCAARSSTSRPPARPPPMPPCWRPTAWASTSSNVNWALTTACSPSSRAAPGRRTPDGPHRLHTLRHGEGGRPGFPHGPADRRRPGLPRPRDEGPRLAGRRRASGRTRPGRVLDPTSSTWSPACSARSPPVTATAARAASEPPASPRSRPSKSWTSPTCAV